MINKKTKQSKGKEWKFALPQETERFTKMNDRLYTYLYSISKHNPTKIKGRYLEEYNYIYLDKGPNGEPKYRPKDTMAALGIPSATYYRKFNTLLELGLIQKIEKGNRKLLAIPFIYSERILNMKVCVFLSKIQNGTVPPDDIIKTLSLLKIWFYGDKKFTYSKLKANLGYSNNKENNEKIETILALLSGYGLITISVEKTGLKGAVNQTVFYIDDVDDSMTTLMGGFEKARTEESDSSNEEKIPIKNEQV